MCVCASVFVCAHFRAETFTSSIQQQHVQRNKPVYISQTNPCTSLRDIQLCMSLMSLRDIQVCMSLMSLRDIQVCMCLRETYRCVCVSERHTGVYVSQRDIQVCLSVCLLFNL